MQKRVMGAYNILHDKKAMRIAMVAEAARLNYGNEAMIKAAVDEKNKIDIESGKMPINNNTIPMPNPVPNHMSEPTTDFTPSIPAQNMPLNPQNRAVEQSNELNPQTIPNEQQDALQAAYRDYLISVIDSNNPNPEILNNDRLINAVLSINKVSRPFGDWLSARMIIQNQSNQANQANQANQSNGSKEDSNALNDINYNKAANDLASAQADSNNRKFLMDMKEGSLKEAEEIKKKINIIKMDTNKQ